MSLGNNFLFLFFAIQKCPNLIKWQIPDVVMITYVAEEVLEVVASGIVVGVQHSGVEVLLLMVGLPVVELSGQLFN